MKLTELNLFLIIYFFSSLTAGEIELETEEMVHHEIELRDVLFKKRKIDVNTRPRQSLNDTTEVSMHLYVYHILSLDSKTEILTINAWLGHMWQDLNLAWKLEDYGGLAHIAVMPDQIWTPDIYLLNSAESANQNPIAVLPLYVSHMGDIWWVPPGTFKSVCPMDLSAYPFDEHTCHLLFISWSHSASQLNVSLMIENYSLTSFIYDDNNEWEIVSSHGNRSGTVFYNINFYIQLRRRAPFYRLTLILPTVMAILITLITFWVPPSTGHKPFVCGINLVILSLLVINLYYTTPRNGSSVPGIVVFCGNALFLVGLTFLLSIATTIIYKQPPKVPPPDWLKNLLSTSVANILCLTGPKMANDDAQLLSNEEDGEEMPKKIEYNSDWQIIAIAFDRFGFIVYCITLLIVLACAFA